MPKASPPNPTSDNQPVSRLLENPIYVFISSHQREFQKLRTATKNSIELEIQGTRWMFKADVTERTHALTVGANLTELLERCEIYVVFIGYRKSQKTEQEFHYALSNGIPILAYEYYQSNSEYGGEKRTTPFLKKIMNEDIIVRGHDEPFADDRQLVDRLINDLLETVGNVIHRYIRIRKAVGR